MCLLFHPCHMAQCTTKLPLGCNAYANLKAAKWNECRVSGKNLPLAAQYLLNTYVIEDNDTHYKYEVEDIEEYIDHSRKLLHSQPYRLATLSRSEQWLVTCLKNCSLIMHTAIIGSVLHSTSPC